MMTFYFSTAVVLLNVLIGRCPQGEPIGIYTSILRRHTAANSSLFGSYTALMNDAFNTSQKEGEIAYWKLLSNVIAGRSPIVLGR